MKAIICREFGPVEQLEYGDLPDPQPAAGQLGIRVRAVGVNFPDALLVQGLYQAKPGFPFVPGAELCGEVESVGGSVEDFGRGERVICFNPGFGAYAEKAAIDASHAVRVPAGMPDVDAANILCAHGTAHHALKQRAGLRAGENLLVLGAAGGTGLAAVQIGKAMGARVIAACSTDEKLTVAKDNGADELVNYSEQDLRTATKEYTAGKGADVVYDPVGGEAFDACSRAMARNGRLLVVGFASGVIPRLSVNLALVKEYAVIGVFWGSFTSHEPQVFAANMQELFDWYAAGQVSLVIDEQLPLRDAVKALQKVMRREVKGKLVLIP